MSSSVTTSGINVVVRGEGPPVFLMHGIGGSAQSCESLAGILADNGYRTLCWDAPGYGHSADPVSTEDFDHVEAVAEMLHFHDAAPAHIFGTSWGGVLAMCLADRYPELVRTLTIADSTRGSAVTSERAQAMRTRISELAAEGPRAFAAARAPRLVSPDADYKVAAAVEAGMARVRLSGYRAAAEMMARTNTASVLHSLTHPALVLVGDGDSVTGVSESRLLADSIPGARFGLILGAGHAACQERPDRVAAHMLRFLERNEK
ncbi:alpha/beta fold hydrolase [Hoyosella subflava]|uniref:Hydrolase, alpha/beta fold family domain protein n=1 Tax=Hoyosella subflava (strain DSM 45089 / JCM 17490 / NBRC 109087 / DQS3-9A1) TaxID=443218 RepID=F6EFM6_HOYSD|nr:alpha/beta hydrolase [Hoyosella subflava]AEF40955.1 Hydrolase, alpha/beta fold family domain protein [Hoyosella subflava DQS3-9A1]